MKQSVNGKLDAHIRNGTMFQGATEEGHHKLPDAFHRDRRTARLNIERTRKEPLSPPSVSSNPLSPEKLLIGTEASVTGVATDEVHNLVEASSFPRK